MAHSTGGLGAVSATLPIRIQRTGNGGFGSTLERSPFQVGL